MFAVTTKTIVQLLREVLILLLFNTILCSVLLICLFNNSLFKSGYAMEKVIVPMVWMKVLITAIKP